MKTVLVTAGYGPEHRWWARRLTDHVTSLGGIPAVDLSDSIPWKSLSYFPLGKLHVWRYLPGDVDRVVWVDTDTYVTRAISADELPTVPFAAVRDPWVLGGSEGAAHKSFTGERRIFNDIPLYFNSGFFCSTRAAIPAFEAALEAERTMFKKRFIWTREQDLFNWAVWTTLAGGSKTDAGWMAMSEEWNWVYCKRIGADVKPVVIHMAGSPLSRRSHTLRGLFAGKDLKCTH